MTFVLDLHEERCTITRGCDRIEPSGQCRVQAPQPGWSPFFVIASCARTEDNVNAEHLVASVRSVQLFHPSSDILVVENCRGGGEQPKLAERLRQFDRVALRTNPQSLFEMGAFALGIHHMLFNNSSGIHKYSHLVLLQHTTRLAGPLKPSPCPTLLFTPWQFMGGHDGYPPSIQVSNFVPTGMYAHLAKRGILPNGWCDKYTDTWISATHGVLLIDRLRAKLLLDMGLLDVELISMCARRFCWESLSGLYVSYLSFLQPECGGIHVHPSTVKVHGNTHR